MRIKYWKYKNSSLIHKRLQQAFKFPEFPILNSGNPTNEGYKRRMYTFIIISNTTIQNHNRHSVIRFHFSKKSLKYTLKDIHIKMEDNL